MKRNVTLASKSPRRSEILKAGGIDFTVIAAGADETVDPFAQPQHVCMFLALKKALAVREKVSEGVIIAADTIVVHGGKILGKPSGQEDAFSTLAALRNDVHTVMTGVAVCDAETEKTNVFCEKTRVYFRDYTDEEIREYIKTGEPFDKAGSYAIQGKWSARVKKIEGDYSNVVGLPWERLSGELKDFGVL